MMADWGDLELVQIENDDFWCLFDEMVDDKSGFLNNRSTILEAYKKGNLYGVRVAETDKMYERRAMMDDIFCRESFYLLPCFCVKNNNVAVIIWTHTRARKMGFARKLVKLLGIEHAHKPLPESAGFWKKCGVK